MQMGAVDYVPKPETARSVNANIDFRRELVDKVKAWATRARKKAGRPLPSTDQRALPSRQPTSNRMPTSFVTAQRQARPASVVTTTSRRGDVMEKSAAEPVLGGQIQLRRGSSRRPKILAIGSSTGGPQALLKFFEQFKAKPGVPIVIVQHMPATFTAILADHLQQATGWPASEGRNGETLKNDHIYVAPGGKHMEITGTEAAPFLRLTDDPPENFCRPAVDPLYRSLVPIYGEKVLAVVLTGMGHDGLRGARALTQAGGTVVAQDEATSVVWGMPGAVATAGLCTEVKALEELGKRVFERLRGSA